ncbi:hypothetical protein [Dyella acidiphila]|uniref:Uncharacterized protein n=1 Tax=Dyella acidiphila TaxID=2775866 RepID=A0ABR9GEM6_9GAMM|nr:hypothetical protein [Dyella acidiphila]MBE1162505.1 hypothetical protein [Dyella acidiphila]
MKTAADPMQERSNRSSADGVSQAKAGQESRLPFPDNRDQAAVQLKMQALANQSAQAERLTQLQAKADSYGSSHLDNGAVIQALTIGYTANDLGHPIAPVPFAHEVIQHIVYQRASIPAAVKAAVDHFGDGPAAGTYKHFVGHMVIANNLINRCLNQSRTNIVADLSNILTNINVNIAGLQPLNNVVAFNTWLDEAFVAICDWPENIFRGPSDDGEPDSPTHPSADLIDRLFVAHNTLLTEHLA